MTVQSRSRVRAVSAFVAIVVSIGASFIACDTVRRANGEECLQDTDCMSLVCSTRVCIAAPPLQTGTPDPGGADSGAPDAGGGADSSDSAMPVQDASDDGPSKDSATNGDALLDDAALDGALVDADAAGLEDARDDAADAADAAGGPDAAFRARMLSRLTAPDARVA
jgi:hypothetical protein